MACDKDGCDRAPDFVVIMLIVLASGLTGLWTWAGVDDSKRKEAVEVGHAEWYIQDHTRQWRWKPVVVGEPKPVDQKKCECMK